MNPTKSPITERNAAAAILQGLFTMVDERWPQLGQGFEQRVTDSGQAMPKQDFVRFNFSLAMIGVNFRAAFDLFPREQAERIFGHMLSILEQQLGSGPAFTAVRNALIKYIDAYNSGILAIRPPLHDVSMLLYYKVGLENVKLQVVDEPYYIPDPQTVEYLVRAMTMFLGRWELLLVRFELVTPIEDRSDDADPPAEA